MKLAETSASIKQNTFCPQDDKEEEQKDCQLLSLRIKKKRHCSHPTSFSFFYISCNDSMGFVSRLNTSLPFNHHHQWETKEGKKELQNL